MIQVDGAVLYITYGRRFSRRFQVAIYNRWPFGGLAIPFPHFCKSLWWCKFLVEKAATSAARWSRFASVILRSSLFLCSVGTFFCFANFHSNLASGHDHTLDVQIVAVLVLVSALAGSVSDGFSPSLSPSPPFIETHYQERISPAKKTSSSTHV